MISKSGLSLTIELADLESEISRDNNNNNNSNDDDDDQGDRSARRMMSAVGLLLPFLLLLVLPHYGRLRIIREGRQPEQAHGGHKRQLLITFFAPKKLKLVANV